MDQPKRRLAVFPGTFDPVTNGHLDVIRRAAALFDELLVAVGENPDKQPLLAAAERLEIVRQAIAGLTNVRAEPYTGLTVALAGRVGAAAIVRGIRNSFDFQSELQMASTNRTVAGVETVLIPTSPEHAYISAGLIRQVARMGGDVSAMVPPQVVAHLRPAPGIDAGEGIA